jgi:hypothetical protein
VKRSLREGIISPQGDAGIRDLELDKVAVVG